MKNQLYFNILSNKRYSKKIKRGKRKKKRRKRKHEIFLKIKKNFNGKITYEQLLEKWLPTNISYLLKCEKSGFQNTLPFLNIYEKIKIPSKFSLIDNPTESYNFIRKVAISILSLKFREINIDYSNCKYIDLGAQIYFDIVMKDIIKFINRCKESPINSPLFPKLGGSNINDINIQKMLFSVGSPAIHNKKTINFNDIVKYQLCIHNKDSNVDDLKKAERKEIDSTKMMDYIINSLKRLNKELTPDKIEDFSTVIGEILINAEEHSTTNYRFSTGYFQEHEIEGEHFGIFNLVILNFGETIYQKFKSPECSNPQVVDKMKNLSEKYSKKSFFSNNFTEENLWTLYALQEGITSISPKKYRKRGNGSIRFIESFFNIKGTDGTDNLSRLSILSGNTNITFDGNYNIVNNGDFKVMAFNEEGSIYKKPDKKNVKHSQEYFPGTIISARILINKDDLI